MERERRAAINCGSHSARVVFEVVVEGNESVYAGPPTPAPNLVFVDS